MMRVIKRNGSYDDVSFDKVLTRIKVLSVSQGPSDLPLNVNCYELAQKVCSRIYDGVKTSELDELAAHLCSSLIIENPDYDKLASRISTSNHHKNTSPSYSETTQHLFDAGLISNELYEIVQKNKEKLNSVIDYSRDYTYDYFGFKTLERSYLLRIDDKVVERAQHMLMRVSLGIHGLDIKDALATYDLMSRKYFIHATPTLFNAGTKRPQCSSCFLVHMKDDSIDGIFNTLKDCAQISKYAGGIGMHIHNVRARNSVIKGTNGISTGVIPMLRVFNNMARYVNQAGKRNGSIAVFLEPWHADVEDFLELRKNHGHEEDRARDLFYAMWVPDLFMERVKANGKWSLMCPSVCPGLSDVWGQEFEELYKMYELEGKWIKQINAQDLWFKILELQIETGLPYIGFKDHVNRKTNQQNIGIIKSSNLCMEICQVSKPDEVAVCNLASVCLKTFVVDGMFDFA
jgi:ribonucleoside-diphosphate reductase alpha chain